MNKHDFQNLIFQKGHELFRDMPWRTDTRPYFVLVSEIMLQQTQVDRVIPKFEAFIKQFPDIETLARAPLGAVLTAWNGLGYNRRAKFLHESAKAIVERYDGIIPNNEEELRSLPGIGANTAGALCAYAYNLPRLFIETNIRTVYFYHFFPDATDIDDKAIRDQLEQTLPLDRPREFYWALMDYGAWLKSQKMGLISQSRHYKKQSTFAGSMREMRGLIVRKLTEGTTAITDFPQTMVADTRFMPALDALGQEGIVSRSTDGQLRLK